VFGDEEAVGVFLEEEFGGDGSGDGEHHCQE
jgi:hypothetical protein